MKIGIYCTNNHIYPVPSDAIYASMSVAGQLADQLAEMGEDVTFFAPIGTQTKAKLITFEMLPFSNPQVYEKYPHEGSSYQYENLMLIQAYNYMEQNNFDVFHSHTRPFSTTNFASMKPDLPTILTVHDPLTDEAFKILPCFNIFKNIHLVSISNAQRNPLPNLNWLGTVHNGIDISRWKYKSEPGKYLLFVGRVMPNKGPDIAVQIARKAKLPLKIIGGIYPADQGFFDEKIKPYLNNKIEYLGNASQNTLKPLYGQALALLMPVRWEEPFGLVMIEAMASGTPVIASRHGSIPEVIDHGKTGFVIDTENDISQFVTYIEQLSTIRRIDCQKHISENFSLAKMASSYLDLYKKIIYSNLCQKNR